MVAMLYCLGMIVFTRRSKLLFSSVFILVALVLPTSSVEADSLNQSVTFSVNPKYDDLNRTHLVGTLRVISSHAYFYIDQESWTRLLAQDQTKFLDNIQRLAEEFDNRIYPQLTTFWGSEATPGLDHDPRVTIVIENLKQGYGGYFDTKNS